MAESPTDDGADVTSGGDEPILDDNQQDLSADEHTDTDSSGETQDSDQQSDTEPQDGTTQDDDSSDDEDGLSKFAKAQGFDPENLTDDTRKALKLARDNQKAFRESTQIKADEARSAIHDANTLEDEDTEELDPFEARQVELEARQARIESDIRLSEFYVSKPEARELDKEMAQIVLDEAKTNGKAAARYLAADLNRLFVLAKARRGDNDSAQIADNARREERENLRKRQSGSADESHASNQHQTTPKVTEDWIDNEYDPSNPEHRQMVDEAMARGDLY